MNQQQKRYAEKRIDELKEQKLKKISDENTTKSLTLSPLERAILIRDGNVTMVELPTESVHSLNYIENLYDFSEHEVKYYFDNDAYKAASTLIINEAIRINDSLILGDAEEAIALIEAFTKF